MRIYLLFSIMEAFISLMLKDVVDSYNLTVLWMFINSFVLIGWFYHKSKDTTMFMFLFIGFLLRLLMMIYDNNVALLPFNTTDAGRFHQLAVETSEALPEQMLEFFTGFYSQVLGVIYYNRCSREGNTRVLLPCGNNTDKGSARRVPRSRPVVGRRSPTSGTHSWTRHIGTFARGSAEGGT